MIPYGKEYGNFCSFSLGLRFLSVFPILLFCFFISQRRNDSSLTSIFFFSLSSFLLLFDLAIDIVLAHLFPYLSLSSPS
ncbi:hypothetical protein B0J12DRAFT_670441 [Macrophomina phaseolina]|uniref:Uncharacterized protein n=1 Tax=Macrophomina phaseolina TaxID=35725 RepID=A0ABQ8G728_9PEZI|nr:hypothetical protein B0J12DRAFT_670441 [Macrophomina phaseolina]